MLPRTKTALEQVYLTFDKLQHRNKPPVLAAVAAMQLLLVVFLLQLAIHIVNSIGAPLINELLWTIWNKFPTPTSEAAKNTFNLRREVLRLKKELNAVSAQDDFAKWAKLRRQHDKAAAELEQSSTSLTSSRSQFDSIVGVLRFISLQGARFLIQFWFTSEPMFWLPRGWLPPYVEWIIALPKAPTGSVSIQLWWISCASVIGMASEVIKAGYVLAAGKQEEPMQKRPQAYAAKEKSGQESAKQSPREKKEL